MMGDHDDDEELDDRPRHDGPDALIVFLFQGVRCAALALMHTRLWRPKSEAMLRNPLGRREIRGCSRLFSRCGASSGGVDFCGNRQRFLP